MENECKGCRTYDANFEDGCTLGFRPRISETEECPCRKCLIKSMCSNVCDELITYLRKNKKGQENE